MTDAEVKNAKIESARLGFGNEHGFLDHSLTLDYGGSGQAWGGYVLGFQAGWPGNSLAGDTIIAILNTVGVSDWGDLCGKPIRALSSWSNVYGIGHYLKDKWVWIDGEGALRTGTLEELKEATP